IRWSVYNFPGSLRGDYSPPNAFNQRQVSFSRDNAREFEPGSLQQVPELRLGPLSATWCEREHLEIQEFTEVRHVTGRNHRIDDEHFPSTPHRTVAISENLNCSLVIPVMDDVLRSEERRVGKGWRA